MTRRQPEAALQRSVLAHLKARGAKGLVVWHTPNGGRRSVIEAKIFKGLGVKPGVPDLCIVHRGRFFGLELKAHRGRTTEAQTETLQELEAAGAVVGIAKNIDQAIAWLEVHQLLRGNTP
jgi:hypothetical protein